MYRKQNVIDNNDNLRTFYPLNKVNIDNRSNVKREKDVNVNSERLYNGLAFVAETILR